MAAGEWAKEPGADQLSQVGGQDAITWPSTTAHRQEAGLPNGLLCSPICSALVICLWKGEKNRERAKENGTHSQMRLETDWQKQEKESVETDAEIQRNEIGSRKDGWEKHTLHRSPAQGWKTHTRVSYYIFHVYENTIFYKYLNPQCWKYFEYLILTVNYNSLKSWLQWLTP